MFHSMEEAYKRFLNMYADSEPLRTFDEFEAAVHATGIPVEQISPEWIEGLNTRWVYGETETPFDDERANREYRRILTAL